MSPRPLLLAAALLAAAGAGARRPAPGTSLTYCTAILIGHKTDYEPHEMKSVQITARDSVVFIPDEVSKPGAKLAGNEVTVCNWAGTGLPTLAPPRTGLAPVSVHLPGGINFQALEMFVLQYVEPLYSPRG